MAATTISRASLTDGVTVWNAAVVGTAVYDKVDALVGGAVTFGGVIGSEGFGTHALSAGGTGANLINLRNTTAGTGNYAGMTVGNDTSAAHAALFLFSTTYTTSGPYVAGGAAVVALGAGGLSLYAGHASGDLRCYAGGTTEVGKFGATDKCLQVSYGLWLKGSYDQTVTGTQTLDSGGQYYAVIRITSATSTPKISSCTAGNDGDIKILVNVSGASCTVQHNGGGPTTRIYCANATDGTIADDESMMLMYDAGSSSWIEIGPR